MKKFVFAAALSAIFLGACKPAVAPAPEAPVTPAPVTDAASRDVAPRVEAAGLPDAANDAAATPPADDDAAVDAAIDAALGDHATYRKVIEGLQKAVAAKDTAAVAALVYYPIDVEIAGKKKTIKDAATFASEYDKFMTPAIAKAITDTRYADVFVNYKGVMLGQGEAWINGICKDNACKDVDVKVVTIQPKSDLSP